MQGSKVAKLFRDWKNFDGREVAATIGNFDGVHLGHKELIQKVCSLAKAKNMRSMLISFEPMPLCYFKPELKCNRLMGFRDKFSAIKNLNISYICALRFNQALVNMPADCFIKDCLQKNFKVRDLVVGEDFRFGYRQQGDVNTLLKAQNENFTVHVVSEVNKNSQRISSSSCRKLLENGEIDLAATMLGNPFYITSRVVRGQGIGNKLGFPTANLSVPIRNIAPPGVYLSIMEGEFGRHMSVTNVGTRPTFSGSKRVVESHLIDYSGNLYGQRAKCTFLKKIRPEIKFPSIDKLVTQIRQDVSVAKQMLESQVSI
jgi:riboflavin kinase/FMN adenylyltransferase